MEESEIQESSGLETSLSQGEVVEVRNGARERDLMEEIGDLRLRVGIDPDLRSQGTFEIHEMSGNSHPEMTEGIPEKGHCQHPLMLSLFVGEVHTEDEEGVIGISTDVEGGRTLKSDTMLLLGAGLGTGIGRGKYATTEIANVIWKRPGGRMNFEESGRNAKEMIVSEGSSLSVQTPGIRQEDNKRQSPLVQLQ